jgi:hypothetical protein
LEALSILFGAGFTFAVALALGSLLLGELCRDWPVRFIAGSAMLSTVVFLLCAAHLAYAWIFLMTGTLACAAAWGRHWRAPVLPRLPEKHRILLFFFVLYFVLYFFSAMAPEWSPDGVTYHLGFVARYFREHGFHRITWNMYASLSEGMEMLFLFAFAFGRHSGASMVHFAFTAALAWQMFVYGRRNGFAVAGACGALLVFASPIVGIDGTSAYNDVAVAAIGFTLFDLVQQAAERKSLRFAAAIGLAAGFCYAVKYTAWPAVIYAVVLVLWKTRRIKPALITAVTAALVITPWMAKNWIWLQNPVSPFYNRYFPNPYITTAFEEGYRKDLQMYDLTSRKQIPMAVTTTGSLGGLLGPIFLLSPIALLALRRREGRQLLLAAVVFGCNYFSNISPRFLIAPLPFLALSMMLAVSAIPQLMMAVAVVHAIISWPAYIPKYCAPNAWHLSKIPYREALRLKNAEEFLGSHVIDYGVEQMVERSTSAGATVFTYRPIPEAYTSRRILVNYESAFNQTLGLIVQQAYNPQLMPTWRLRFGFARRSLQAIRITQTNTADDLWNIHELRIFDGAAELPRRPEWRLTAQPYPWSIQEAFDNRIVTFWRCGETARPGQFVQVDFHRVETVDGVTIETAPDQPGIRLKLDGQDEAGRWAPLAGAPQISDAAPPLGLRQAAMEELRRCGVDYILTFGDEGETRDLRAHPAQWGIREIAHYQETKLYELGNR